MSSSDLLDAVERKDWDEARSLLSKTNARDLIEYNDIKNRNAIHRACYSGDEIPSDIFRAMLVASETAPLQQDEYGSTPLHCAIMNSADKIIIELIEACPWAASIANNHGWTPLHDAITFNKSSKVIRHILAANPTAATNTNDDGDTFLCWFFGSLNVPLRNSLHLINDDENAIQDVILQNELGQEKRIGEVYQTTLLLLQAASHGRIEDNQDSLFRPLCAAIIDPRCPWSFVNLILMLDQKQASQWDREENLPIHIAAAASSSFDGELYRCNECNCIIQNASWFHGEDWYDPKYCRSCIKEWDNETRREEFNLMNSVDKIPAVIGKLLSTNLDFAKIPNREGRLPLHIATENERSLEKGLETIFRAAPKALDTRDIITHLYPFMLTAAKYDTNTNKLKKFTLCFAMLTKNPILVSSGIPKN